MESTVFSSCDKFPRRPFLHIFRFGNMIAAGFSLGQLLLAVDIKHCGFSVGSCCGDTRVRSARQGWRGLPQNRKKKKKYMKTLKIPHSTHPSNSTSEHGLASRRKIRNSSWVVVYAAFLIFFQHLLVRFLEFGVRRWRIMIHDYNSYN